eukprot:5881773-Pyramimonas_sp.AAC.1
MLVFGTSLSCKTLHPGGNVCSESSFARLYVTRHMSRRRRRRKGSPPPLGGPSSRLSAASVQIALPFSPAWR